MNAGELLDRLCAAHGIVADYRDIHGERQTVADDTRRALLAAMGVAAPDDDLHAAWAALQARRWRRWLEPVSVQRQGGDLQVDVRIPAGAAEQRFDWILRLESGAEHRGTLRAAAGRLLDTEAFDDGEWRHYRCPLPVAPAAPPPTGYHRLELRAGEANCSQSLILVPARCYQPEALREGRRVWGFAVQLYALRTRRNWGIGDFTDLESLIDRAAGLGADVVGLSPLHALFPANPLHASPYSPSSRQFLNLLLLDVEAVAVAEACAAFQAVLAEPQMQARIRALRDDACIRYDAVAALKLSMLEPLYEHFCRTHLAGNDAHAQGFQRFWDERGAALSNQARFDALQEHFRRETGTLEGWPAWPEPYRDPGSPAVAAFAAEAAERVRFYAWLYWHAELQLSRAGARALDHGLGIGLYQDLALSSDRNGAEVWANRAAYAAGVEIGSPPDDFNLAGQNWGLPPLIPQALRESAYAGFIALLRENMRQAGALRLDHVMSLQRLFWIPAGRTAAEGGYVEYPADELFGILALESQRNRCLVVGEDLGTVPEGLRERLAALGILSYRLLYFEKDASGAFAAPREYPDQALVTVSTHDLPTLTGFWYGEDLELRNRLALFPTEEIRQGQILERAQDRTRLLMTLEREALLPPEVSVVSGITAELTPELVRALHLFLAHTPARLFMVRLEDVLEQREQINLPGTTTAYPNWQYKLPLALEDWSQDARVQSLADALRGERPRAAAMAAPGAAPGGARLRVPGATYRLQFNRDFTFAAATDLVGYLARLGVTHCYASPFLKARPGSMHGYDIVDHAALNPEIGTRAEFDALVDALHAEGMGLILDTVPNHMAVMGSDNAWWLDVLENGPASAHADHFDIDWETYQPDVGHKILLPVLGDHYARVLDNGELRLEFDAEAGAFSILYYEHRFPVDPREYPRILGRHAERLATRLGADDARLLEFQTLVTALGHLPARSERAPERNAERQRDKEVHKRHLAQLCADSAEIAALIADNVADLNREGGDGEGVEALHELIAAQAYRLAYWRVASDEINYRRFFDINDLAALRMEIPQVFEATHRLVFELIATGRIDGLRIDHPDGLYDPVRYFWRLQSRFGGEPGAPLALYVVVEKILAEHENLPEHWPVHGTTGYDFANLVNGLFVDPDSAGKLARTYRGFTDETAEFEDIVYRAKILTMRNALASEHNVLSHQASRIAQADRYTRDFTLNSLRRALTEVVACFPVYRSYVTEDGASPHDQRYIDWAVSVAKRRSQAADIGIFDFLRELLSTRLAEGKPPAYREAVTAFARKFQQYTAPVMAKGLEDTSFYIYNRLVALNEVGGDPRRFGVSVESFHHANEARARAWPHAMLATSTHDSKRSEDVRARIDVLSELPDDWRRVVSRWHRLNRSKTRSVDDNEVPSRNDQYLFYQTLVGVWDLGDPQDEDGLDALAGRVEAYMLKAVREAKVQTSWINPNPEYEDGVSHFVRGVLHPRNAKFLADLHAFQRPLAWFGMLNSLAQLVLKFCVPGMPDTYQGTELWDLSLVDPDNRRPVDYRRREAALQALIDMDALDEAAFPGALHELLAQPQDGRIKLYLLRRLLAIRRESAALFRDGGYVPLVCTGAGAGHLCAFARTDAAGTLAVVVPRLGYRLLGGRVGLPVGAAVWSDTRVELPLPVARWTNLLARRGVRAGIEGERAQVRVAELFDVLPFAVLRPDAAAL